MPRRKRLDPEQIAQLKFEDCRNCLLVLTGACRGCEAGENFEPADEVDEVDQFMKRWG